MITSRQIISRLKEIRHCRCECCVSIFVEHMHKGFAQVVYHQSPKHCHVWYVRTPESMVKKK